MGRNRKSSICSKVGAPPPFLSLLCPKRKAGGYTRRKINMAAPAAAARLAVGARADHLYLHNNPVLRCYYYQLHFTDEEVRRRKGNNLLMVTRLDLNSGHYPELRPLPSLGLPFLVKGPLIHRKRRKSTWCSSTKLHSKQFSRVLILKTSCIL